MKTCYLGTKLFLFIIIIIIIIMNSSASFGKPQRIIVALDGSGQYKSINEAIQAAPANSEQEVLIYIKKGIYREKVYIDRPNITLCGESRKETQIIYPEFAEKWMNDYKLKGDTTVEVRWGIATVNIHLKANDCNLLNLTVYNNYGTTIEQTRKHLFAVFGRATRTIILNCDILSDGSDDLSLWNLTDGMYYHADCYFRCPGVDFVCPRGWCFIENCIFDGGASAQIWHDGSNQKEQKFVLRNCRFTSKIPSSLGRFHKDSQFYLLNCHLDSLIKDEAIDYAYKKDPQRPLNLKWGKRIYYYNCTRDGEPFEWMKNNLHLAENNPKPEQITPKWTFDGKWDPMAKVRKLKKLYAE